MGWGMEPDNDGIDAPAFFGRDRQRFLQLLPAPEKGEMLANTRAAQSTCLV